MLSLTFFPNNEIRVRVASKVPSRSREKRYIASPVSEKVREFLSERGVELEASADDMTAIAGVSPLSLDSRINGDLYNINDSIDKPTFSATSKVVRKGGWGFPSAKTSFGNNARRNMLRGGGALQKLGFGVGTTAFFTGTLPGNTDAAKIALASWSGYISNRLTQWFRRHNINHWGYVWEWQKRLALHIHLFAASDDVARLQIMIDEFREFWINILDDVSARSGQDLFEKKSGGRWDAFKDMSVFRSCGEWVRKNVAGYLSKYVSKNSATKSSQSPGWKTIPADYYPSRWWGMSSSLKAAIDEFTFTKSITLTEQQEKEIAWDIVEHLQPIAVSQYAYADKYFPDNNTFISYLPDELFDDSKYLFDLLDLSPSCLLSAKVRVPVTFAKAIRWIISNNCAFHFMNSMSEFFPLLEESLLPYLYSRFKFCPVDIHEFDYTRPVTVEEIEEIYSASLCYLSEMGVSI